MRAESKSEASEPKDIPDSFQTGRCRKAKRCGLTLGDCADRMCEA